MDSRFEMQSDRDILPADEISVAQSGSDWRPSEVQSEARSSYRLRMTAAWLVLLLFGSSLIWSLTWLRPQPTVRVSLIGASYAENLSVDSNIYGWKDLDSFASLLQVDPHLSRVHLASAPVEFHHDTQWDVGLNTANEETVVVYFSAHGAADPTGPYLLPVDCDPDSGSRLDVAAIVDRLGKMPANKKKLLVLDAAHFNGNWQYGILHNDFARSMLELNHRIAKVPNLVVICTSGENEIAWDCAIKGQTAFGHYLQEALRGAAADKNQNGRIDAEDVFLFTRHNVQTWVQTAYGQSQIPFLLPVGSVGIERAAKLELVTVNPNYQPPLPPRTNPMVESQLKKIWQAHENLLSQSVKPYAYWPSQWRLYERAILRYETLVQANEPFSANRMLELISSLQHQFEWENERALSAEHGNLFIGKSLLGVSADSAQAQQITDQLWANSLDRARAQWKEVLSSRPTRAADRLRTEVLTLLYERATADPIGLLAKSAQIAKVVLDPIEPPPSEINFLLVLDKYLPADSRTEANADLIRLALQVRLLAERVAVSYQQDMNACTEGVYPWIANEIQLADQNRLFGEDLVFAGPAEHDRSMKFLRQAAAEYETAARNASRVREAYLLINELAYRLPHHARWIAGVTANANDKKDLLQRLEVLFQQTHLLNEMLSEPNPALLQLNRSATSQVSDNGGQSSEWGALVKQTEQVKQEFSVLNHHFESWWEDQVASQTPDLWQGLSLALSLPYGQPQTRITLLVNQSNLIQANPLHYQNIGSSSEDTANSQVQVAKQERMALDNAVVYGRLTLATIGQSAFDEVTAGQGESDSYQQLNHRLGVLAVEDDWGGSIQVAGAQVRNCMQKLNAQIDQTLVAAESQQRLSRTSWLNAILNGQQQRSNEVSPNSVLRDRRQSQLFQHLAIRSLQEHWMDIDGAPYFQQAARRYYQTALRSWKENPELAKVESELNSPEQLTMVTAEKLQLTTQRQLPFEIGLQLTPNKGTSHGFPILWIKDASNLTLSRPLAGQRLVQNLVAGKLSNQESCLLLNLENDDLENTSTKASEPLSPFRNVSFRPKSVDEVQSVRIEGFFRGQQLSRQLEVEHHIVPNVQRIQVQRPTTARLAVTASPQLQGIYGEGRGAVSIVLDASGSMGAEAGKTFGSSTKYAEATRAIRELLVSLPDGIQLSIWVFGQAKGPQKTVRHAEETIQQIVPPMVWDTKDSGQINSIIKNISWPNIEPWNESPIVETVLAAKQDVVGQTGFKTVVLLTDGIDNRVESSNAAGSTVAEALRTAFDQSGVTLNVVGFKVASREWQAAQEQFKHVETLNPPGRYFEVTDASLLADVLKSVLHQRIRYWLEDNQHQPVGTKSQFLETGMANSLSHWFPDSLDPGSYWLRSSVSNQAFPLQLHRGDRLVLEMDQKSNQLISRRPSLLQRRYAAKPGKGVEGWRAAVMENRVPNNSQRLSLLVGLENLDAKAASVAEMIRPEDIWFEVHSQAGEKSQTPTSWYVDYQYAVAAWRLEVRDWTEKNVDQSPATPVVDVWWNPDRSTPAAVRLERGRDFQQLIELTGKKLDVNGIPVLIESVQFESRQVQAGADVKKRQPCLVVRLKYESEQSFWVKPFGLEFEGSEQKNYDDIGSYTGVFWPVSQDKAEQSISRLGIFALEDLKEQAESRGCHLRLDNLSAPRPDDVVFPPFTDSEN